MSDVRTNGSEMPVVLRTTSLWNPMFAAIRHAVSLSLVMVLVACSTNATTPALPPVEETGFQGPYAVQIAGYDGHAMEPFVTRDGQYLLFNNRNDPGELTDLHIARRTSDSTFVYVGPLAAANSTVLDGVPAGSSDGTVYFVSLRSYAATYATIHRTLLTGTSAGAPSLVPGVSTSGGGMLDFDVDVAADGRTLTVARGRFTGSALPAVADLVLYAAAANGNGFVVSPASASVYAAVNTGALEYAPATSADGLTLSFTRWDTARGQSPALWIARRSTTSAPWGPPARIRGPVGVVEAGSWSPDARTLYYHAFVNDRYVIQRLVR